MFLATPKATTIEYNYFRNAASVGYIFYQSLDVKQKVATIRYNYFRDTGYENAGYGVYDGGTFSPMVQVGDLGTGGTIASWDQSFNTMIQFGSAGDYVEVGSCNASTAPENYQGGFIGLITSLIPKGTMSNVTIENNLGINVGGGSFNVTPYIVEMVPNGSPAGTISSPVVSNNYFDVTGDAASGTAWNVD
jgi:hypothetical protein